MAFSKVFSISKIASFITVVLVIVLAIIGFIVPNFSAVFWVPAVVLIVYQSVYIFCSRHRAKQVFAISQLLNYVVIGAFVGSISMFLHNADQSLRRNAEMDFVDASEKLPFAIEEAAEAETKSIQSSNRIRKIDAVLLSECMGKRLVEERTPIQNDILEESDYRQDFQLKPFTVCDAVLSISDTAALHSFEAEQAKRSVERLSGIVETGGNPTYSINAIIPLPVRNTILLIYVPMLLLSSVMFNVVRTTYTHSLITSGWLRPRNQTA